MVSELTDLWMERVWVQALAGDIVLCSCTCSCDSLTVFISFIWCKLCKPYIKLVEYFVSLALKSPIGEWPITYTHTHTLSVEGWVLAVRV